MYRSLVYLTISSESDNIVRDFAHVSSKLGKGKRKEPQILTNRENGTFCSNFCWEREKDCCGDTKIISLFLSTMC